MPRCRPRTASIPSADVCSISNRCRRPSTRERTRTCCSSRTRSFRRGSVKRSRRRATPRSSPMSEERSSSWAARRMRAVTERTSLIETIRAAVIGDDEAVMGPFGLRRVTYADYTASGRSLAFVEDYIRDAVLPLYGNTHTESSGTGLQTTRFREDARAIIRDAVGGTHDEHVVIFCGSGSTATIHKLADAINLRLPAALAHRCHLRAGIPADERPVV